MQSKTYGARPGVPGGGNGSTGGNGCVVKSAVGGILVADDIGGTVRVRGNVAVVRGRLRPGDKLVAGDGTLGESPHLVETRIFFSTNVPRGDITVSLDKAGTGGNSQELGLHVGRHFEFGYGVLGAKNEQFALKFVEYRLAGRTSAVNTASERMSSRMFKRMNVVSNLSLKEGTGKTVGQDEEARLMYDVMPGGSTPMV